MNITFYIASAVATISTIKVITEFNAIRALLYLIVSLLSVAVVFFSLGAPFAAAIEVITYAGAIMVLFVFVIMMFNLGPISVNQEREWLKPETWIGPLILAFILFFELTYTIFFNLPDLTLNQAQIVGPKAIGAALFGPYAIGVELASMLLLSSLIGAYHLGYRTVTSK
ncbi:MAG: NADH-quinone oxidoreductase subunit J [Bdellovibrionia bacterium]